MQNTFLLNPQALRDAAHLLSQQCHGAAVAAGWWSDLDTGARKERNTGELLMLIVSEVAEAMEGARKNLPDDKLVNRPMIECELADCVIRCFDTAGGLGLDIAGAIAEKMQFNATRADHAIAVRRGATGKKF
jgi:NTP pyrophosphatase (non-canonical NTP hydrolase)